MPPNFWEAGHGLIRVGSAFFIVSNPITRGATKLSIILSIYTSRAWTFRFANRFILHPIRSGLPGLFCEVVESHWYGGGQRRHHSRSGLINV